MNQYIFSIPCYENLILEEQQLFYENCRIVDFESREAVFKQGSFAVNIYIIIEGYSKLTYQSGEKKRIIYIPKKGDIIGKDYLSKAHYPYSLHALTKTKFLVIPKTFLNEICNTNLIFNLKLTQLFESKLIEEMQWIIHLGFKNVEGSVAMFLLKFCNKEYKGIDLSRAEIAELIGYSRENIIHTLKKFVAEKLIETKGKDIKINNIKKLKEIIKYS